MTAPFARIDRAAGCIQFSRGDWSETFPVADLPRRVAFYEGMAKRDGGRFAGIYEPDVAELRRVQKALEARPV